MYDLPPSVGRGSAGDELRAVASADATERCESVVSETEKSERIRAMCERRVDGIEVVADDDEPAAVVGRARLLDGDPDTAGHGGEPGRAVTHAYHRGLLSRTRVDPDESLPELVAHPESTLVERERRGALGHGDRGANRERPGVDLRDGPLELVRNAERSVAVHDPAGPLPTAAVFVARFVAGSIRTTVLVASSVTQTAPPPIAIPRPTAPVRMVSTSLPSTSIRERVRSSEFVTQTDP